MTDVFVFLESLHIFTSVINLTQLYPINM